MIFVLFVILYCSAGCYVAGLLRKDYFQFADEVELGFVALFWLPILLYYIGKEEAKGSK